MVCTKARSEVLERHRVLVEEALALKDLLHRPLVELFELPGRRGVSHSGGVPAFSEDAWLLQLDYNVRSGFELSGKAEVRLQKILERLKYERNG